MIKKLSHDSNKPGKKNKFRHGLYKGENGFQMCFMLQRQRGYGSIYIHLLGFVSLYPSML